MSLVTNSGRNRLCRICIDPKSDLSVNITEDSHWAALFEYCVGIPLSHTNIEGNIQFCKSCAEKLKDFSNFKRRCIKSDNLWKSMTVKVDICKTTKLEPKLEVKPIKEESSYDDDSYFEDYVNDEADVKDEYDEYDEESTKEVISHDPKLKQAVKKRQCYKCDRVFRNEYCTSRHIPYCQGSKVKGEEPIQEVKEETKEEEKKDKKPPSPLFYCGICDFNSNNSDVVLQHVNDHATNNDLQCKLCDHGGLDFADMISHRYKHHPEEFSHPFICPVCNRKYFNALTLEFHYRKMHLEKSGGLCSVCEKAFNTYKTYRNHMRLHTTPGYICDFCGHRFLFKHSIVEHMQTHMGIINFTCEICGKGFHKMSNLKSHVYNLHTLKNKVKCTHCNKTYACQRALNKHMQYVNKEKPFACDSCPKTFPSLAYLQSHAFWHTGEKPFACTLCNNRYKAKSALKIHLIKHSGNMPFTCIQCGKGFPTTTTLKRHMNFHSGVRPVKCLHCDRTFYSKSQMMAHCSSRHKV